jgi:hypothetical protein
MIAEERLVQDPGQEGPIPTRQRLRAVPQARPEPPVVKSDRPSVLWRLIFFFVGLGLVMLGWPLAVSAIGSFIGIPLIIFGLALMQAQDR